MKNINYSYKNINLLKKQEKISFMARSCAIYKEQLVNNNCQLYYYYLLLIYKILVYICIYTRYPTYNPHMMKT